MTNFSHLAKLDISAETTGEYSIEEIEGEPVLVLRPANESNADYMNARLRLSGKNNGFRKAKKVIVDTSTLAKLRDDDRQLFPEHVIVGWENVLDSAGKAVKFSPKVCAEFIAALPDWIFDGVRGFAVQPESFLEIIDSEEKAGN